MSDFILPDIGEGIVECELVKWLIQEGDQIEEDQPVAEVMTDKALVEIPAPQKGRVTKLYYQEGEIARVHSPLFAVEVAEEDGVAENASQPAPEQTTPTPPAKPASPGKATAVDFILPDIGEGIVECEVVTWRIKEGDDIEEDQPVVDVMTDKAMVEITAPRAGTVTRLYYQQEQTARVHAPLFAYIPSDQDTEADAPSQDSRAPSARKDSGQTAASVQSAGPGRGAASRGKRIPASPAVRRLVREQNLDLAAIPGTGKDGRVLKEDIIRYAKQDHQAKTETGSGSEGRSASGGDVRIEPLRGVRAVMARRMAESASTIPHFTFGDEVDMTALMALREQLKPQADAAGVRLTPMAFIMKALAMAVVKYPILNSQSERRRHRDPLPAPCEYRHGRGYAHGPGGAQRQER